MRAARPVSVSVRCKFEAGTDIVLREIGEVFEDLALAHTRGQIFPDIVLGDPEGSNAGLSSTLGGINLDAILICHKTNPGETIPKDQTTNDLVYLG